MLVAPSMKLRTNLAFLPGGMSKASCRTMTWPEQSLPAPMPMVMMLQAGRDFGGQHGRDGFEDDHRRAGFLQGQGIVLQALRGGFALALHLVAAERMHRLRRQADVAADRDAALDEKATVGGHFLAAFELDHLRAGRHQRDGVAEGLFRRFLVAAEGHVGNDEGAVEPRLTAATCGRRCRRR
jgi:hypothetical protein